MASNLLQFMADLANDPKKLAAFKDHPDVIMDLYNLTQEQKDKVLALKADNKQLFNVHGAINEEIQQNFDEGGDIVC